MGAVNFLTIFTVNLVSDLFILKLLLILQHFIKRAQSSIVMPNASKQTTALESVNSCCQYHK